MGTPKFLLTLPVRQDYFRLASSMSKRNKNFLTFNLLFSLALTMGVLSASFSVHDFSTLNLSLYKKLRDDHKLTLADKATLKKGRRTEADERFPGPSRDVSISAKSAQPATQTPQRILVSQFIFAPKMLTQISQSVLNL